MKGIKTRVKHGRDTSSINVIHRMMWRGRDAECEFNEEE
jgi:hypothetical protein